MGHAARERGRERGAGLAGRPGQADAAAGLAARGAGTGLLGGFTTFSTYAVQVTVLGRVDPVLALGYLILTPLLCVAAAALAGTVTLRAGRR